VSDGELFHARQSEPVTALARRVARLEHAVPVVRGDDESVVLDEEPVRERAGRHRHVGTGVLERVREQVLGQPLERLCVRADRAVGLDP